jgi:hypothetical protein
MANQLALREANAADAKFYLCLAREAYREVLNLQFSGWDEAVHGWRFAEKVASLPFFVAELGGEGVAAVSSSLNTLTSSGLARRSVEAVRFRCRSRALAVPLSYATPAECRDPSKIRAAARAGHA